MAALIVILSIVILLGFILAVSAGIAYILCMITGTAFSLGMVLAVFAIWVIVDALFTAILGGGNK